jgi:hypothetical protein
MRRVALITAIFTFACCGEHETFMPQNVACTLVGEGFLVLLPEGWEHPEEATNGSLLVAVRPDSGALLVVWRDDPNVLSRSNRAAIQHAYILGDLLGSIMQTRLRTVHGLGEFYARALYPPLGGTPVGPGPEEVQLANLHLLSCALPDEDVGGNIALRFRVTSPVSAGSRDAAAYGFDTSLIGRRAVFDYAVVSNASEPFNRDADWAVALVVARLDLQDYLPRLLDGLRFEDSSTGEPSSISP